MNDFPCNIICETSTVTDGTMSFRSGDTNTVARNRLAFLKKCGIESEKYVPILCDHGETIVEVTGTNAKTVTVDSQEVRAEVVVTQEKNLPLFLLTADCIPMSFYDPVTETIALAHVSRVTLGKSLPQKTVGFLWDTLAVQPENLLINIGPHIKKESYKFALPLATVDQILAPHIYEAARYAHIDLLGASMRALTQSGIHKENIHISDIDTATSEHHFSYYRMKKMGDDTKPRIATILMLRS